MNTTTNYSLPQWEATDAVTRGDVNSAMSSIDSAIAGAGGAVLLAERTLGEGESSATIELNDLNWSDWLTVTMTVEPVLEDRTGASYTVVSSTNTGIVTNCKGPMQAIFFVGHRGDGYLAFLIFFGTSTTSICYSVAYDAITSFTIRGQLEAGTTVKLWGVR